MARYIGAIDQGTTSTRFIVFDRTGATIDLGRSKALDGVGSTVY
jgi:glycerol kinase